jgi:hypothetical protein
LPQTPQQKSIYNKNYKAWKSNRGNKGGDKSRGGGDNGENKTGGDYNRRVWDHDNLSMVNGSLMVNCKDFVAAGASWKLAWDHPYSIECRKLGQANPSIAS